MDCKEKIKNELFDKLLEERAFWSFSNPKVNQISDEALIENVIIHLDSDEIKLLFRIFEFDFIKKTWEERILTQEPYYHSLNRLMAYKYFGIDNPDEFIENKTLA